MLSFFNMKYKIYKTDYKIFWNDNSDDKPSKEILDRFINEPDAWTELGNTSLNYVKWDLCTVSINSNLHPTYFRIDTFNEDDSLYSRRFYFINRIIKETSNVLVYELTLDYYSTFFNQWLDKWNNSKLFISRGTVNYQDTNIISKKYLYSYEDELANIISNTDTNIQKYYAPNRQVVPNNKNLSNYQNRLYIYSSTNNRMEYNFTFTNPLQISESPIGPGNENCLYYVFKFADSEKIFAFPLLNIFGEQFFSFGKDLDFHSINNPSNSGKLNGSIRNTISGLKLLLEKIPNQFVGICAGINPFLMWDQYSVFCVEENNARSFDKTFLMLPIDVNGLPIGNIVNKLPNFPIDKTNFLTDYYAGDFLYNKYTKLIWGVSYNGLNPKYISNSSISNEDAHLIFTNGFKIMDGTNTFSNDGFMFDFGVPVSNSITQYAKYLEQQKIVWDMGLKTIIIDTFGSLLGAGSSTFKASQSNLSDGISGTATGFALEAASGLSKGIINYVKFGFAKEADKSLTRLKLGGKTIDVDTTAANYMLSLNNILVDLGKTYICSFINYSPISFNTLVFLTAKYGIVLNSMINPSYLKATTPYWYIKPELTFISLNYNTFDFKDVGMNDAKKILYEFSNGYRIWDIVDFNQQTKTISIDRQTLCKLK